MNQYESPTIEIQEVLVEKGFAGSDTSSSSEINGSLGGSEGMGGNGNINVEW